MCPSLYGLSHVSVPSYCPTWDRRDCPRDSHVSQSTWLVPCVRPVHGTGGTVLGTPMCPSLHGYSPMCPSRPWDRRDCPRESGLPCVPAYMACPMCPSRPTVLNGTGGTVLGTPLCLHDLMVVHVSSIQVCELFGIGRVSVVHVEQVQLMGEYGVKRFMHLMLCLVAAKSMHHRRRYFPQK